MMKSNRPSKFILPVLRIHVITLILMEIYMVHNSSPVSQYISAESKAKKFLPLLQEIFLI